jgi:cathepsin L
MVEFGRAYAEGTPEFEFRDALFRKRAAFIVAHNARPGRLWDAGFNELTDRTEDELAQLRGWRHVNVVGQELALLAESAVVHKSPDKEVDWRSLNMAREVPDQGGCGSCWAVAAASMLEARSEVRNNSRTFSAQQLVNCVPNPKECGGAGGCQGATVELAMKYIEMAGLEDAEKQPYHGRDLECLQPVQSSSFLDSRVRSHRHFAARSALGLKSWHKLPENRALPLMLAAMDGPVAISVGAEEWSFYAQGIFNGCSKDAVVDHAVTLFGYGEESGTKYWLIRNSWGSSWGEQGFIRLLRHDTPSEDDEYCGTDHDPSAGLACKPYPKKVTVCGMCGLLYDSVAAHFAY